VISESSGRYAANVARPKGGKREYLIGLKKGLLASVKAGKIIITFTTTSPVSLERECFSAALLPVLDMLIKGRI
jgi:hypothetical protein